MLKKVLKYAITYIVLIIFFIMSLCMVASFPSSMIYENVKESSEVLKLEGNRKKVNIPYRTSEIQFDNFTDALMINTAYSIEDSTPLESTFLARKNYIKEKTKKIEKDEVGELRFSLKYKYHDEVTELADLLNSNIEESHEYARYWHGYLIILRPILILFNINEIRLIIFIILIILISVLLYLLQKRTNIVIGLIFAIGLFCVEYFYLGYTLQGISVFLIAIIASIILLLRDKRIKSKGWLFFIVGILTNFFDFLTTPMITLCVPLLIVLILKEKEEEYSLKKNILEIIKLSLIWLIGYAITWFTKWALVDIIFKRDLVKIAFQQIGFRTVAKEYTILDALGQNIMYEDKFIIISSLITTIISIIYLYRKRDNREKGKMLGIIPYVIIVIAPYIWYAVLKNHSVEHAFFTYRNQVVTIIGLNIVIYKLIMNSEIQK